MIDDKAAGARVNGFLKAEAGFVCCLALPLNWSSWDSFSTI